ncbi:MAG: response regulator [Gallionellaceae bacterium]
MDELASLAKSGRVLVVDDERSMCALHKAFLSKQFEVDCATSGAQAIEKCLERLPDLVLMDIEMPDMDGIETCRRLREWTNLPIIFATGHESIEEHLRAYDAGGDDIITKPVRSEILLRKVENAIRHHKEKKELVAEKASLHQMAMSFLSTVSESGALLNFMRASVTCRNHHALAEKLLETTVDLGVQCSVMIRHAGGPTILTPNGEPTELERSVLEKSSSMGRVFQFKSRLVVNYDRVSLIVAKLPASEEQAGRIRDYIAILAETTEGMCDNVDMRIESMNRAEQLQVALGGAVSAVEVLQKENGRMLLDVRMLLQELIDNVEKSYSYLNTTNSQESTISNAMNTSVQQIISVMMDNNKLDKQFGNVLDALRGGSSQNDLELF